MALGAGNLVGWWEKYPARTSRWNLFHDADGAWQRREEFALYTLMGVATTAVFWVTQTAFWLTWGTELAREAGAVLGLTVAMSPPVPARPPLCLSHHDRGAMTRLAGWGRFPPGRDGGWRVIRCEADVAAALAAGGPLILRGGNGRAYGDSAVSLRRNARHDGHGPNAAPSIPGRACLVAEAGVLLAEIIETFLFFCRAAGFPPSRLAPSSSASAARSRRMCMAKNHHLDGSFRRLCRTGPT